jgi:hypothetical protein
MLPTTAVPVLLKLDKDTNIFHAQRLDAIKLPDTFIGATLTEKQKEQLFLGKLIKVEGMISKRTNKPFDGNVQYDAEKKCLDLIINDKKMQQQFPITKINDHVLTEQQQQDLEAGNTIFVADFVSKDGKHYDSYITKDTKSPSGVSMIFSNPQKAVIPAYHAKVEITKERIKQHPLKDAEKQELDAGRMIMIAGMADNMGKQFTAHIIKKSTGNTHIIKNPANPANKEDDLDYVFKNVPVYAQALTNPATDQKVTPTPDHKVQVEGNNYGNKPQELAGVKAPLEQSQPTTPTQQQKQQIPRKEGVIHRHS